MCRIKVNLDATQQLEPNILLHRWSRRMAVAVRVRIGVAMIMAVMIAATAVVSVAVRMRMLMLRHRPAAAAGPHRKRKLSPRTSTTCAWLAWLLPYCSTTEED